MTIHEIFPCLPVCSRQQVLKQLEQLFNSKKFNLQTETIQYKNKIITITKVPFTEPIYIFQKNNTKTANDNLYFNEIDKLESADRIFLSSGKTFKLEDQLEQKQTQKTIACSGTFYIGKEEDDFLNTLD